MKKIKKVIICLLLMFVSINFFACNNEQLPELSCVGVVNFMGAGLDGVTIKTNLKDYTQTNFRGEFNFTTNSNGIEVYPSKAGYIFEPSKITLTPGQNEVNFEAIQIEELSGTLKLNSIQIKPTSIVQTPFNYSYLNLGKSALKVKEIEVSVGSEKYDVILNQNYLNKQEQTTIVINKEITLDCGTETSLGVLINAYFTSNYQEGYTTETEHSEFNLDVKPTNADLQKGNGKVIYSYYNINSSNRAFTFDVSFIFDFMAE